MALGAFPLRRGPHTSEHSLLRKDTVLNAPGALRPGASSRLWDQQEETAEQQPETLETEPQPQNLGMRCLRAEAIPTQSPTVARHSPLPTNA